MEHDVTESSKEFQIVGPADLNPREPKTVLTCGTTDMKGLWHGLTLKSGEQFLSESELRLEASGGVSKGGCAGPQSGECNNPSKCVQNSLYARQILV